MEARQIIPSCQIIHYLSIFHPPWLMIIKGKAINCLAFMKQNRTEINKVNFMSKHRHRRNVMSYRFKSLLKLFSLFSPPFLGYFLLMPHSGPILSGQSPCIQTYVNDGSLGSTGRRCHHYQRYNLHKDQPTCFRKFLHSLLCDFTLFQLSGSNFIAELPPSISLCRNLHKILKVCIKVSIKTRPKNLKIEPLMR